MAVIGRLKAAACLTNDCNSVNNSIHGKANTARHTYAARVDVALRGCLCRPVLNAPFLASAHGRSLIVGANTHT